MRSAFLRLQGVTISQPVRYRAGYPRYAAENRSEAPPDYESHFELGVAFRQMEMWEEAAREFKLAAQGLTDPLPAYERLGECLLALRRYDEARRTLEVAMAQPGPDLG